MVTAATSLGRSGLHDFIIQRLTAVILAVYVIYLVTFAVSADNLQFAVWQGLFAQQWFKIFSLLAVGSLVFHAWIGLWVVATDYIKPTAVRLVFQSLVIVLCFAFLIWGAMILWGV